MRSLGILLAVALVASFAASANADLIAYWNFNNATNIGTSLWQITEFGTTANPLEYQKDQGNATHAEIAPWTTGDASEATLVGTNGGVEGNNWGGYAGTTLNAISPDTAGDALSILGTSNNGKYFLLEFDDAMSSATLTYATRGTATGYNTHNWEYSTDGGATWNALSTHAAQQTSTWVVHTVALNNIFASTFGAERNLLRITVTGATSTNGNNRFDNIQINGTNLFPEPATLVLLAIGGLALIRRR
ncbi:MAG TPA: PEP-CTERM sorting domain-containing protein [Phycisphaerae bacterium]|nr:PEP-CTERM sorting domain-containing protein [Phycisphaerae bacterium]